MGLGSLLREMIEDADASVKEEACTSDGESEVQKNVEDNRNGFQNHLESGGCK